MRIISILATAGFIGSLSFLILLAPRTAHAYLDPGTGSAILQGLLAVIAAVFIVGKMYWRRARDFFMRGKKNQDSTQNNDDTNK